MSYLVKKVFPLIVGSLDPYDLSLWILLNKMKVTEWIKAMFRKIDVSLMALDPESQSNSLKIYLV